MASKLPRQKVSSKVLQQLFNEGHYWDRLKSGEFTEKPYSEGIPAHKARQPPGTTSQMISYLDRNGREIARVHQYLHKDGTLGGSGKPDPKKLLHNGVLYVDP